MSPAPVERSFRLTPIGEGFQAAIFGVNNRLPNSSSPFIECFRKPVQLRRVRSAPLARHLRNAFRDFGAVQVLDSREERLKGFEPLDLFVNQPARVKSSNWGIRKTPVSVVEAKALIDQ
jgi:hypothetical protein